MKLTEGKLPKGFVLAKPIAQENYDESVIYELERQGRLIITRKRDGWKMLAHVNNRGEIHLYTDGINEIDPRLDHIKKELKAVGFSPNTLVVGEAIVDLKNNDDIGKVISIFHSNLEKSLTLQKQYGMIRFMVFAIISLSDKNSDRFSLDIELRYRMNANKEAEYVFTVPILVESFDRAKELVLINDWEGLVLYDEEYNLTYRTDGKAPKRPEGCYKWKPILEDDFIVRERIFKLETEVLKELILSQSDPETGWEFYCGKLGSFTNQMRADLSTMRLPIVVQARFDMRFPKSGKVRNARFLRVRDDKPIDQCVAPKSYLEAEYR